MPAMIPRMQNTVHRVERRISFCASDSNDIWKYTKVSADPMMAANSDSTPIYWLMSVLRARTAQAGRLRSTMVPICLVIRAVGLQASRQRVSSEQHSEQIGPE